MIRAAVILLLVAVGAHAADLDAPRFLGAIRAVEAWHGHDGRAGERGPWQITRDVWAMHMPGRPFAEARQAGPARACAVKHLAWLRDHLHAAGADDNAVNLALCWNAGLTATITGRAPLASYDYAGRVENLYILSGPPLIVVSTRTSPDTSAAKLHEARPLHFSFNP